MEASCPKVFLKTPIKNKNLIVFLVHDPPKLKMETPQAEFMAMVMERLLRCEKHGDEQAQKIVDQQKDIEYLKGCIECVHTYTQPVAQEIYAYTIIYHATNFHHPCKCLLVCFTVDGYYGCDVHEGESFHYEPNEEELCERLNLLIDDIFLPDFNNRTMHAFVENNRIRIAITVSEGGISRFMDMFQESFPGMIEGKKIDIWRLSEAEAWHVDRFSFWDTEFIEDHDDLASLKHMITRKRLGLPIPWIFERILISPILQHILD